MTRIASNSDDPLPAVAEQMLKSHEQAPARKLIEMPSKAQARILRLAHEHGGELALGGENGCKVRRDVVDRMVAKGLLSSTTAQQASKYALTSTGRALGLYFSEQNESH